MEGRSVMFCYVKKYSCGYQKDIFTSMFIVAFFTIAKIRNKCPSMDGYRQSLSYTHVTGILFSQEREGNPSICENMDESRRHYAKWNNSKKDRYCIISLVCGNWKKLNLQKQREEWWLPGLLRGGSKRTLASWLKVIKLQWEDE